MKPSEIYISKTYRGKNRVRRKVDTMSCGDGKTHFVYYSEKKAESCCRIETFARWAQKEV